MICRDEIEFDIEICTQMKWKSKTKTKTKNRILQSMKPSKKNRIRWNSSQNRREKIPPNPPKERKKPFLALCSELPRFSYRDLFAKRQEVSTKDPSGGVSSSEKPGKPGKPGTRQVKKVVEVTDEDGFTRGNGKKCAL